MQERIADAADRLSVPIVRADDLAAGGEDHFDQVLKAAAKDFHVRTVGTAANQCAAVALKHRAIRFRETITIRLAHGHVKQSIRTEEESVQTTVVLVTETGQHYGA